MKFPQNIIKNLGKKHFNEYKYIIFIVFLLLISFLINKDVDNCKKLTLLFTGLLICIYQPLLVIPFLVFLVLIHIIIGNKKEPENIEPFYTTNDNLSKLENKKLGRNNKSLILDEYDNFKNFISETYKGLQNDSDEQINEKQNKKNKAFEILLFYKNFFDIYFMDINNENDWNIVNKILEDFERFDDFIDMSDMTYSDDVFIKSLKLDNTYKDNNQKQLLKKLCLFFYQGDKNNKTIFNQIIFILKHTGLYPFYMGIFKGTGIGNKGDYYSANLYNDAVEKEKEIQSNYEKIKKFLFEIGILHYKSVCEDIDADEPNYFNEKGISNLEFEPYLLYNKDYIDSNSFEDHFNILNDLYVIRIPSRPKNFQGKIGLLIDEKESKKIYKIAEFEDTNELKTTQLLETEFGLISKELEDNFISIKLLDQNFYKIEPNFKIAFNYLTLFYIIHNAKLKEHLDNIKENQKRNLLKLFNNKKNEFNNQIEAEKLGGIYELTSLDDLFLDNIFYYYQLTDKNFGIEKIFPIDYHIEKLAPEETEDDDGDEDISSENDRQQMNYQKTLESDFDSNLLSNMREEQLNKYYSFLDKNKYEAINSLNKLAEAKNEKMRIENQSFTSVIDDFSKSVFDIIDEIVQLVKDTSSDNLETFSNSPSPIPSSSLTNFQKFIIFIKKLTEILINDKRAIHTGFVLIIIALFIYFIDSKETGCNGCCNKNSSSLLSLLKLK